MKCPICLDATYLDREGKPAFWALDCYSDPKDVVKCKCQEREMTDLETLNAYELGRREALEQAAVIAEDYGAHWKINAPVEFIDGDSGAQIGKRIRALIDQPAPPAPDFSPTDYGDEIVALRKDLVTASDQLAAKDARIAELEAEPPQHSRSGRKCATCGSPLSIDCPDCQRLWAS